MASLYTNENFLFKVGLYLREMGHDVLTSHEAGQANRGIPDKDVLEFALKSGRILLTLNRRDFIALHEQVSSHAGIVVCTQNPDRKEQAEQIHQALQEADEVVGKLVRVNRKQK